MRRLARNLVVALVRKLTGRVPVLLPPESAAEGEILPLLYRYRLEECSIAWTLDGAPAGDLSLTVRAYRKTDPVWSPRPFAVGARSRVTLDTRTGALAVDGRATPVPDWPFAATRKLVAELSLEGGGRRLRRRTMHYRADAGRLIDEAYYTGDDYFDYEAEQRAEVRQNAERVAGHLPSGARLLEIGCATGLFLDEMKRRGFDPYGIDGSEWAIARAAERVGEGRAKRHDADSASPLPFEGTFDVLYMNDVIEHFSRPWEALGRFSAAVRPGGLLFLATGNAASLTARWFGEDWEGFSDYSHLGIREMTEGRLRRGLAEAGWEIEEWLCDGLWLWNADPVYQCLNDFYYHDARFRRLVAETGAGDIFRIRARRR